VLEVATGKETGEAIDARQFGPPAWTDDNRCCTTACRSSRPMRRDPTSI
jgi:hypothetical protein